MITDGLFIYSVRSIQHSANFYSFQPTNIKIYCIWSYQYAVSVCDHPMSKSSPRSYHTIQSTAVQRTSTDKIYKAVKQGGGGRNEVWDRVAMLSQLATWSIHGVVSSFWMMMQQAIFSHEMEAMAITTTMPWNHLLLRGSILLTKKLKVVCLPENFVIVM